MSKRCELQKEYYQANGNYKGSGKYSDDYVIWLENEVLALRQPLVSGQLEAISKDFRLWYCAQSQPLSAIDIESWFASNLR
jgi:hypothetical protein